jgi:hypothetical protein
MMPTTSHWMITASASEYHLTGHQVLMPANAPRIDDIAHALAQINRFNGHAKRPYSVAEHSLLVADIAASRGATPAVQLACLLHDAHEAYVSDLHSPAKWALGVAWIGFEAPHIANVRAALGIKTISTAARAEIKRCDLIALATERRDLTVFDPAVHLPWPILDTPGQEVLPWGGLEVDLMHPWHTDKGWRDWRGLFLARHTELREAACA